jgi:hydrogenase maturation protein HypF
VTDIVRRRIRITGIVQGVGFRPHVHTLATHHGLTGTVANDDRGVTIEVQGRPTAADTFLTDLLAGPPPAAIIQQVDATDLDPIDESGFRIVATDRTGTATTLVSPDLDVCADCVSEMTDPHDRRYRYPFINCTNCGPRFSIIRATPYDRPATTMAAFEMCTTCRAEYEDPTNRRFHAQPNACADCGPRLWLQTTYGTATDTADAIAAVKALIRTGGIIAIKGIGGFHLACDATSAVAVEELRRRKRRSAKPFAVMAADVETARTMVDLSDADVAVLTSRAKPIVLSPATGHSAGQVIAPGQRRIGVMLPYTPLHHMLLDPGDIWVMTSGNIATEPIITTNEDALLRLADVADAFLLHDRDIARPIDDSVVVSTRGDADTPGRADAAAVPVRRSRGFAPLPVDLAFSTPPMLAVGGELKATLCLADGSRAFLSQHIGDMENLETLGAFEQTATDLQDLLRIDPELLVCDMHPAYLSRRWAHEHADGRRVIEVQHHHAHIASLLAEHRWSSPVIGISFDGTGYGADGTVWGGEILVGDLTGFERAGHLQAFTMPGGDVSVRNPYRLALSLLHQHGHDWAAGLPPVDASPEEERAVIAHQLRSGLNALVTTSAGRLFDAVASLAGVCHEATYEAQAAMEFEALVEDVAVDGPGYKLPVETRDGMLVLSHAGLIRDILSDLDGHTATIEIAAKFHRSVARAIADAAAMIGAHSEVDTVGLSGGVFQNRVLTRMCTTLLNAAGFSVLTHRLVPPNDAGLALGQIALAVRKV